MSICEGIITRRRVTQILNEKSSIDVFLVCGRTLSYVKQMFIDEKMESFNRFSRTQKITESDHNKLILFLNLETLSVKPQKEELFNFKSALGQTKFFEMTNNSEKFRKCFKTESAFLKQAATFENTLRGYFQKSFQNDQGQETEGRPVRGG